MDICKDFKITKHKAAEIQLSYFSNHIALQFYFNVNWRQDHAGFNFILQFGPIFFTLGFYDTRHWDYEKEAWKVYDER